MVHLHNWINMHIFWTLGKLVIRLPFCSIMHSAVQKSWFHCILPPGFIVIYQSGLEQQFFRLSDGFSKFLCEHWLLFQSSPCTWPFSEDSQIAVSRELGISLYYWKSVGSFWQRTEQKATNIWIRALECP